MSVRIAIKPKYPTRRATDKVLFNEGNFIDTIDEHSTRHILSILDTAHVALVSEDGKYYPIDKDNYEEQYKLADAGETPTVEADEKFGVKKLEEFITATVSDDAAKVQNCAIYNGIIVGQLLKVSNYLTIDDERFTKNGYYLMFDYDKTSAEAEGYSNAKLLMGEELVDGSNLMYFGEDASLISDTIIAIESTLTVDGKAGSYIATFNNSLTGKVLIASDDLPYVAIGNNSYDSLASAIASATVGDIIEINKSIPVPKTIAITKDVTININNDAVVTVSGYICVKSGGKLTVTGNGTIKESTPYLAPIILMNEDENSSANAYIAAGITLWGWAGLMFDKKSVNINATCHGTLVGNNDGSDDGAGFYCNGNVKEGTFNFTGSTKGTVGNGMYIAGNLNNTITGAYIEGTQVGIEVRAGSLDISNSTIKSLSSAEPAMAANGNGATATAVGLAVAQHTTKRDMKVSVNNCTLTGSAAFMEGNPQKNPDCTKQMNIAIGGESVMNGKILTLDPENDCKNFVYESRCSEKPDNKYIAKGYEATETFTGTFDIAKKQ